MIPKLIVSTLLTASLTGCGSDNVQTPNTYTIGELPGRIGRILCVEGYKFHYIKGFNDRYVQVFELDEHGNSVPVQCGRGQ